VKVIVGKLARFVIAPAAAAIAQPDASSADILQAPGGGTIRALVIGVDAYPNLAASAQLHGARADAEDIAAALRRGGVEPIVILDADATRAKIVAQMDSFVAESKPGDLVLFAYAGHGMQVPEYPRWQGIDRDGVNEQIALSGFRFSGAGQARSLSIWKCARGCRGLTPNRSIRSSSWIRASAGECARSIRGRGKCGRASCTATPSRSKRGKATAGNLSAFP
jgi:uncharacterized low-complexity protein